MDTRRKTLGRRIRRARVAAGYRSQKAFARAIGVHERSVAGAEGGEERTGDNVFAAIEAGLGWPADSATQYLETGELSLLPVRGTQVANRDRPHPEARELVRLAIGHMADIEVNGADATTYNQHLEKWAGVLAIDDADVDIEYVRREAHRIAAERLAKRRANSS